MINVLSFIIEDNHTALEVLFYFKFIVSFSNVYWFVLLDSLIWFLHITEFYSIEYFWEPFFKIKKMKTHVREFQWLMKATSIIGVIG